MDEAPLKVVVVAAAVMLCYSYKSLGTSNPLSEHKVDDGDNDERPDKASNEGVTGVVTNPTDYGTRSSRDEENGNSYANLEGSSPNEAFSNSWKLNIILAVVACWYAMALTGWGAIEAGVAASLIVFVDISSAKA
eukprot:3872350-Ditylum_brightwellii.AAC.1